MYNPYVSLILCLYLKIQFNLADRILIDTGRKEKALFRTTISGPIEGGSIMKRLDMNKTVAEPVTEYPEVKDLS